MTTVEPDEVEEAVGRAICAVATESPPLQFKYAAERAVAHRLAVQLERHRRFAGWNIDSEYNRDGQMQKFLAGIAGGKKKTDAIFPDIIVHHREGEGRAHNLLAVEMKRASAEDEYDKKRLQLLTSRTGHYDYQYGLYVNVDDGAFRCTWYRDGTRLSSLRDDWWRRYLPHRRSE